MKKKSKGASAGNASKAASARYATIGGVKIKVANPVSAAKRAPEIREAVRSFYAARRA